GKCQSVDKPEEKSKEIDQGERGRMFDLPLPLQQIVNRGRHYCQRDQEFDPTAGKMHEPERAKRKGSGVPDGKSRHQDHYLSPVLDQVAETKRGHKKDMIHGFPGQDVVDSDTEVKREVLHICKIIQTFVVPKFTF